MVIKDAAKIDMYSLHQFLAGRQREMPQEIIQALDIALRECPASRYCVNALLHIHFLSSVVHLYYFSEFYILMMCSLFPSNIVAGIHQSLDHSSHHKNLDLVDCLEMVSNAGGVTIRAYALHRWACHLILVEFCSYIILSLFKKSLVLAHTIVFFVCVYKKLCW